MQLDNIFTISFFFFFFLSIFVKVVLDIINYYHRKRFNKKIPSELAGMVDEKKILKINEYSNAKLVFSLFEYFFDKGLLICILFLKFIPHYYNILASRFHNIYILGLLFFGGYLFLKTILDVPFSLYFNFVLEKKFQFNKMDLKIWIGDFIKKIIVSCILSTIIIVPLIFFLYTFETFWWLFLWFFFLVFSIVMQIIYPTIIAPLFNKFEPLDNIELKKKIEELLNDSNLKLNGVFKMDASKRSSHSNAYFSGLGKSKRLVLFDSLLEKHSENEILSILAHEVGHYKYKHVLKNLIFVTIFSFISLFVSYLLIKNTNLYIAFGFMRNFEVEKIKFIGLFLIAIFSAPISFFLTPLGVIFSRKHERQADRYSVKKMKSSIPLIDALKKMSIDNLSNIYPSKIYAWFYYSHPPLFQRIKIIQSFDKARKLKEAQFNKFK